MEMSITLFFPSKIIVNPVTKTRHILSVGGWCFHSDNYMDINTTLDATPCLTHTYNLVYNVHYCTISCPIYLQVSPIFPRYNLRI